MTDLTSWTPDPTWQRGHHPPDHVYDLVAEFLPQSSIADIWARVIEAYGSDDDIPGIGGAAFGRDGDLIVLSSGGEDAIDSLGDAADALVEIASACADATQVRWHQRPPRYVP